MDKSSTHTRIYVVTLTNLRHIHAETGEKHLDILDRLIQDEWQKVKAEVSSDTSAQDQA